MAKIICVKCGSENIHSAEYIEELKREKVSYVCLECMGINGDTKYNTMSKEQIKQSVDRTVESIEIDID